MLRSIDYPISELLIIDNGGGITEIEVPDHVRHARILSMPSNLGVATSWNLGIKAFARAPVFFFSSADTVYEPGALEVLATAERDKITLCQDFPHWQTFGIGEQVVDTLGLFDEAYHPIYFEDTDYLWRAEAEGVTVVKKPIQVRHDNSSTIKSSQHYASRNASTFAANKKYFEAKQKQNKINQGGWVLDITRSNSWDA